ncbi:MAG: hypothetical protein AB7G23_19305 [Vicinamibacterales bacterium]
MVKARVAFIGEGPNDGETIVQLHLPKGVELAGHGAALEVGAWYDLRWSATGAPETVDTAGSGGGTVEA